MNKLFLSTAFYSAAAIAAVAASTAAEEKQTMPELDIDTFLSASNNMQEVIKNQDPVLEKLDLDADDLEIMMPDEQFQAICDAITAHYTDADFKSAQQNKLEDAKTIFGAENAKEIQPFIGNQPAIDNARRQLRGAYDVFADYHSTQELASSVVDWNWGDSWGVTINPTVGTLGLGISAGYEFNRFFKIRAHYGTGRLDTTMRLSDTNMEFEWENQDNYGLFVDWHPKGSQFHVTVGLMRMDPRIRVEAKYHGTTNAYNSTGTGYNRYDVHSTYTMDGDWENEIQPYIGIGWDSDGSKKRTLYFSVDLGLAYLGEGTYKESGSPKFYRNDQWLSTHGEPGSIMPEASDTDAMQTLNQFDSNVRDAVDKVADFLNDLYVYPVIQVGFGIRF